VFKLFVGAQNRERWDIWMMFQDTMLRMNMVNELLTAYLASPSHWLFGLGTQAYPAFSSLQHADYVHNVAAEILCQHGIVGFALFIGMIVLLIKHTYRLWMMYYDDPAMRSTVAVLTAICFYSLLLSLKQGSVCYPQPFYWWLVLAKLAYHEELVWARAGLSITDLSARSRADEHTDGLVDDQLAVDYGGGR
jgi:O-antigen ligase